MIRFDQVCKRYPGGQEALRGVSFAIPRGEMTVVTGHTGAGKTTLLKLIAAIDLPSSGQIIVNGQNIGKLRRSAIPYLRRKLGLIFQDHRLLYDRSVFENVLLPLQISEFPRRESLRRARAALDKVGLLHKEKTDPIALSGGEQQRLCIARAIVNRPAIILADEPTGNLDTDYANDIVDLFKSFNQVGATLVIATHDEHLIQRCGTRTLILAHGALHA